MHRRLFFFLSHLLMSLHLHALILWFFMGHCVHFCFWWGAQFVIGDYCLFWLIAHCNKHILTESCRSLWEICSSIRSSTVSRLSCTPRAGSTLFRLVRLYAFHGHMFIGIEVFNHRILCFCWDFQLFCDSNLRPFTFLKTKRVVRQDAWNFGEILVSSQISTGAECIGTSFLSIEKTLLMKRFMYVVTSKTSTAKLLTILNHERTCIFPIFTINEMISCILIYSFVAVGTWVHLDA